MQHLGALDTDKTPLAAQLREENVRAIHLHHLSNFVQTVQQNVVNLIRIDNDILDIDLDAHDKLSQLLLGSSNLFLSITGDIDLIFTATVSAWWRVAEDARKGRREVDGSTRGGLDELDVFASATTD